MKIGKINMAKLRHHAGRIQLHGAHAAKVIYRYAFSNWKRIIISLTALLVVPIMLVQLFYPGWYTLPNTTVGSVKLGAAPKTEVAKVLDEAYVATKVPVYFTHSDKVVVEPTLGELGVTVRNDKRVDAYTYPFGMRLVPWSLFWYQTFMDKGEPEIARNNETLTNFIANRFEGDCEFAPINGTIVYSDGVLRVVDAARGGSCDIHELTSKLENVSAQLKPDKITISGSSIAPEVSTETARAEFTRLTKLLEKDVPLKVEETTDTIPKETVKQWITYSVQSGKLALGLNTEAATKWLTDKYGKRFITASGTTVIATKDFTEVSRETGKNGQTINANATIEAIAKDLKGEPSVAQLVIDAVAPKVTYTRSYSSTDVGLSAVMKNYADTHAGTYGVKLVELTGAHRNAEYKSTAQFTTASTYKLFVAYSALLRIESGAWQWTDQITGGRDVSRCLDDMIKLSDNACADAMLRKIGFRPITDEARAIGATSTSFLGSNGIKSTAQDEALLLSLLYSGQILSQQSNRDKWINAMKQNIYRQGIPKGIPGATVANKVGFLDGLLHDAAIVYSPKGAYVLVILTNNASWGNIAELAKEIEAVR